MSTQVRLVTADELLQMPSDARRELIEGEIHEMSPSGRTHGRIASRFHSKLAPYVYRNGLGEAYIADAGFRIETGPDTVLAPDAAFVTAEREAQTAGGDGFFPGAPDLALEVISPSDRYSEVAAKVQKYLGAGTRMVVVVDPPKRTVIVHRSSADVLILEDDDVLDGGDVVPGWTLQVRELFD